MQVNPQYYLLLMPNVNCILKQFHCTILLSLVENLQEYLYDNTTTLFALRFESSIKLFMHIAIKSFLSEISAIFVQKVSNLGRKCTGQ